ncbi:hypothetical protein CCACVL1_16875 [Corchorus capsularis]|uniref:BHLH domain-containing protein n=1 Tax=Corchorus capsularis TaxID=210143 RepID=A0A1R3HV35_COCAP|nr:hypothetical protein CCACVL1_16875 [Corchorus capsularis]
MSSPYLANFSTITEAADDLWPLTQEDNMTSIQLVLEPGQEGKSIGKEVLGNGNADGKQEKHQCPFPIGNGKFHSISFLEQENSALDDHNMNMNELQLQYGHCSDRDHLLSPLYGASDYACSLIQGNSTNYMPTENNARSTAELDSSIFGLEPVLEPNIINNCLSAALEQLEDSDEQLDLLLQESSTSFLSHVDEKTKDDDQTDLSFDPDQQELGADPCNGKGLSTAKRVINAKTSRRRNNYRLKGLQAAGNNIKEVQLQGELGSTVKKQQHNAKERVRRMKLHASYLALGALLPADSTRSKKRKSAPHIIDRAVDYIPELEEEIEKLTLRKNHMLAKIKNKQPLNQNPDFQLHQDPSVLVHEIKQGEFIIQICRQKHPGDAFSNLLHKVEEEKGMSILSASTLQVSDYGLCYHLHIQINEISLNGANHLTSLREKVISWLH